MNRRTFLAGIAGIAAVQHRPLKAATDAKLIEEEAEFTLFAVQLVPNILWLTYGDGIYHHEFVSRWERVIPGEKIIISFSGRVGVLVTPDYTGETEISDRGPVHWLTESEQECVIVVRGNSKSSRNRDDYDLSASTRDVIENWRAKYRKPLETVSVV